MVVVLARIAGLLLAPLEPELRLVIVLAVVGVVAVVAVMVVVVVMVAVLLGIPENAAARGHARKEEAANVR